MSKLILGSHVPMTQADGYFLGAVKTALADQANTLMVYTGPPQNNIRVDLSELKIPDAQALARANNLDLSHFVVHAPYIINLASHKPDTRNFSINCLVSEIRRTHALGIRKIVLHPGFYLGQTIDQALITLANSLKAVLSQVSQLGVVICLETMSGKGTELGTTFEQLAKLIKLCDNSPLLAVCIDTCHLHDAGYDLSNKKQLLTQIDQTIGLERVQVLHINDSCNPLGSNKDRHANIGYGYIGFQTLLQWIFEPAFAEIPKILETPYYKLSSTNNLGKLTVKSYSPYKLEIELIKTQK